MPPLEELNQRVRRYRVQFDQAGRLRANYGGAFGDTKPDSALRMVESIAGDPSNDRMLVADEDTRHLRDDWERRRIAVPLKVLEAPYRDLVRPLVNYVQRLRETEPQTVIVVFIPEYVVTRWWQQLLHNQSALRFKARLLFTPGVVVVNVPYQLGVGNHSWLGARTVTYSAQLSADRAG